MSYFFERIDEEFKDYNYDEILSSGNLPELSKRNEESEENFSNCQDYADYNNKGGDTEMNDNNINGANSNGHTAANSNEKQIPSESNSGINNNDYKKENNNKRIIFEVKKEQIKGQNEFNLQYIKEKFIEKMNLKDEVKKKYTTNKNVLNIDEKQTLNKGRPKKIGRKKKGDKTKRGHSNYSSNNMIIKIKGKIINKYLLDALYLIHKQKFKKVKFKNFYQK